MPIFRYKALTETGKKISGIIDADSFELAKERLRRKKILVTKIFADIKKEQIVLKQTILLNFTRELSQLLKAGLPLYESLQTIEEKYRRHHAHRLFVDLCDRLKSGHLLSSILKTYPKSFDRIYISMVEVGEKTGALSWAFIQLFALIEKRQKLKKQLISSMAYPMFLGVFCFCVVIGLLLFVIPSMSELFQNRHLHPLTQCILNMSEFLKKYWLAFFLTITASIFVIIYFLKQKEGKLFLQRLFQKIPLIKTILNQAAWIRFCRSTSLLLFGGIPLVNALNISREGMKHPFLEEIILKAEKQVIEGCPLSELLKKSPHVPHLISRMLAIGEETGKLHEMFQSLSDIYDDRLQRNLNHITTFLQPILLLIMGGIVGLIILSILLPLSDVSSLIST